MYTPVNQLEVGDSFIEDTYPEVWTVITKVGPNEIIAESDKGAKIDFFESPGTGFTLCLIKIEKGGKHPFLS